MKGAYQEAITNKTLAAKILLPLIEFEFVFLGSDSAELVQSSKNQKQLEMIYKICRAHDWTTQAGIWPKGENVYFRIRKESFAEIYKIAGPFASDVRNRWAELLIERGGTKGGYMVGKTKTEDKVLQLLKQEKRWWRIDELCLNLRLLPSVIRGATRTLFRQGLLLRKRVGKAVFWKVK